ncbi:uncharacterized protein N7484_011357 [Penicillium longicatenatum]|uniref:uncharacterized protein n=1 Tax=Penicillium longicatenatum TaxID=1561947 RepID=UPI002548306B|nr:uncharacterized protein N7484_011357 [Penicillium longicatenatum]KAJ5631257.1 hypothetical protein N7484_011357 [Penicillium longicatenatum]
MPEHAEVARIVHFIRKHLVGKTLSKVQAQHDDIVYGKVGTSAEEFQKSIQGKKIVGAGQQGKYFWITMSSPPHPVMHFGMSGWLKIKDADTYYYRSDKPADKEWPPKYTKFLLETSDEPKTEAAFVDARRLSRIRLVDCPADEIRQHTPLKENGPDPVADKDIVNESWLMEKLRKKRMPIKALLLDQANLSGIGNWMADEILYHAKIHPEQISNTLSDGQIKELHTAMYYVFTTALDVLADSEKFPEHWLFKHRWGKGKKNQPSALPNGDKIIFVTVGGRTSAVVPAVQKKSGTVGKDEDTSDTPKRKRVKHESDSEAEPKPVKSRPMTSKSKVKEEPEEKADAGIRRRSTRAHKK